MTQELQAIKKQYETKYGESLDEALGGDTSGGFKSMLQELAKGEREQGDKVDSQLAIEDAKKLCKASIPWAEKKHKLNCHF